MPIAAPVRVDHLAIARHYADQPRLWPVPPRFEPARRWYACLADDTDAQVWLLTWLPGQGTDLHDHGGSSGAFAVVAGALTEEVIRLDGDRAEVTTGSFTTGAGHDFGAHYVHRMTNRSTEPAISIHVYGPRLTVMHRYEVDGERIRRIATDRAGVAW